MILNGFAPGRTAGLLLTSLGQICSFTNMRGRKSKSLISLDRISSERKREIVGLLMLLVALLTITSLATNSDGDEEYFRPGSTVSLARLGPENSIGYVGMIFSHFVYYFFGLLAFFIPIWSGLWGLRLLFKWDNQRQFKRLYYASGLFLSISVLTALSAVMPPIRNVEYAETLGGLMSHLISSLLYKLLGSIGMTLVCAASALMLISLLIEWRPKGLGRKLGDMLRRVAASMRRFGHGSEENGMADGSETGKPETERPRKSIWQRLREFNLEFLRPKYQNKPPEDRAADSVREPMTNGQAEENFVTDFRRIRDEVLSRKQGSSAAAKRKNDRKSTMIQPRGGETEPDGYQFPSLDLLDDNPQPAQAVSSAELQQTSSELLNTLRTFGVEVEGGRIEKYPGPVITRYEFKPGTGIKVNQILNLSDDLALALRAKRVRIIAPVPGKAAVGVEIPNRKHQTVYLKDILKSEGYGSKSHALPLALGRTTSGEPFVTDLTSMPHLLVAGATGSGKSVCLNVLVTSLIYRHSPKTLRFLLIDPKMLELSVYKGIPHLERPVVTNYRQAERLLNDAVSEMEQRYKRLASENVRNVRDYNVKVDAEQRLPYIVVVVDELADLMMSNTSARTETLITRLAQMARAVGIHLILATQRPSVDVITGLIKANFPARIAFQVATRIDSRTILDGNGAERLLGAGDMLFLNSGQPEPTRIHGAFISSAETSRIVEFLRGQQIAVSKIDNFTDETSAKRQADLGVDPLLKEAAELVVRHKQGSVSLLQRRLGIGYQRAARLIDQLEEKKIVGVYDGSKAREVLVDEAYLNRILQNQ